ncbi:MAG: methanogenesis marker radical SAM protein [Methanocalculus sp. MSAO_Arc1]|uniref:methyl coenzyme M reductase-arginine methyltransferase Mmp10 n=1 Tax=Methanocalculus TaxID=71151 RepID=UPI000FF6FC30|nr:MULTISPECIES: methyl coenzyme M reductase-arginine methyltransferase Mmp10 [unclassified Methanocalculus]MCP1661897.1 methanogenesis marker radical SAM protein [Methanocalculus sp. AMF5]RQD81216.1 MAG: methanogenesis marker radical SAM protein [Methanocalculus sp. MSAO_Arc1]
MVQLTVDIGGRPGLDCRGYCSYCYFRHMKNLDTPPFGCRYCLVVLKGCEYCTRGVREEYSGFKPLREVADAVLADIQSLRGEITRITISGGGDPSCYPDFRDLIELLASLEAPLHIGYTSGKGFDDPDIADFLIESGLAEISFTVFAADPDLRRQYMHDPSPDASLEVLRRLAEKIDVYAASVVLPGVNDGDVLLETCRWLEQQGVKGHILMRFANASDQGLILGNEPIIADQNVQSVKEFAAMVATAAGSCRMKVSGTPLLDTEFDSPFAIRNEPDLLSLLPRIEGSATVVTGSVAAPFIRDILSACGGGDVVAVAKEIACLITADDLATLDLFLLSDTVIIPGRSFVFLPEAESILSRDGKARQVIRGPETLTADAETSMGMTREGVLEMEISGFSDLIRLINQYGGK